MPMTEDELEGGADHSKPTTPTSEPSDSQDNQVDDGVAETETHVDKTSSDTDMANGVIDGSELEIEEDPDISETKPLRTAAAVPSTSTSAAAAEGSSADELEKSIDEAEALTAADLESQDFGSEEGGPRKKPYDVRCILVGILVLVIIVAGASAAILAHRFTAKPKYDFKFAPYFADHMVLQRAPQRAVVWGYGPVLDGNTTVTLTLVNDGGETKYTTHVKNSVRGQMWKVLLDAVSDPGPYTVIASLDDEEEYSREITDVLFGDVWVCAGQFDLQYPINELHNSSEARENQDVRLFGLTPHKSNVPRYTLEYIQMFWSNIDGLSTRYTAYFPELCWLYGRDLRRKLGYPVGLVALAYSDSLVEEWAPPAALSKCGVAVKDSSSTVWNAMVNPMLDISIFGVVWYQGEQDAIELSSKYNCTFVQLINQWRELTYRQSMGASDISFPVGIIQLPPNKTSDHFAYSVTDIRWRQTANYGFLPNPLMEKMYMAATIDLPEAGAFGEDSYTSDPKRVIIHRLLLGTLALAYQQRNITYLGPFPTHYTVSGDQESLTLQLDTPAIDLKSNAGFEVCCSDSENMLCLSSYMKTSFAPGREWVAASIVGNAGGAQASVTLSLKACQERKVVGLRYAWRDTPCHWKRCPIYGTPSELPMMPYIAMPLVNDGRRHELTKEQLNLF